MTVTGTNGGLVLVVADDPGHPIHDFVDEARAIAELAAKKNYDLSLSFAYGDSHNDLPMLELVGIPVAINPDAKLADVAYERGWPVVQFAKPRHRAVRRLRTAAMLGAAFCADEARVRAAALALSMSSQNFGFSCNASYPLQAINRR